MILVITVTSNKVLVIVSKLLNLFPLYVSNNQIQERSFPSSPPGEIPKHLNLLKFPTVLPVIMVTPP